MLGNRQILSYRGIINAGEVHDCTLNGCFSSKVGGVVGGIFVITVGLVTVVSLVKIIASSRQSSFAAAAAEKKHASSPQASPLMSPFPSLYEDNPREGTFCFGCTKAAPTAMASGLFALRDYPYFYWGAYAVLGGEVRPPAAFRLRRCYASSRGDKSSDRDLGLDPDGAHLPSTSGLYPFNAGNPPNSHSEGGNAAHERQGWNPLHSLAAFSPPLLLPFLRLDSRDSEAGELASGASFAQGKTAPLLELASQSLSSCRRAVSSVSPHAFGHFLTSNTYDTLCNNDKLVGQLQDSASWLMQQIQRGGWQCLSGIRKTPGLKSLLYSIPTVWDFDEKKDATGPAETADNRSCGKSEGRGANSTWEGPEASSLGLAKRLNELLEPFQPAPGFVPIVVVLRVPYGYDMALDAQSLCQSLQLDSDLVKDQLIDVIITYDAPPPRKFPSSVSESCLCEPKGLISNRTGNEDSCDLSDNVVNEEVRSLRLVYEVYPAAKYYRLLLRCLLLQEKDNLSRAWLMRSSLPDREEGMGESKKTMNLSSGVLQTPLSHNSDSALGDNNVQISGLNASLKFESPSIDLLFPQSSLLEYRSRLSYHASIAEWLRSSTENFFVRILDSLPALASPMCESLRVHKPILSTPFHHTPNSLRSTPKLAQGVGNLFENAPAPREVILTEYIWMEPELNSWALQSNASISPQLHKKNLSGCFKTAPYEQLHVEKEPVDRKGDPRARLDKSGASDMRSSEGIKYSFCEVSSSQATRRHPPKLNLMQLQQPTRSPCSLFSISSHPTAPWAVTSRDNFPQLPSGSNTPIFPCTRKLQLQVCHHIVLHRLSSRTQSVLGNFEQMLLTELRPRWRGSLEALFEPEVALKGIPTNPCLPKTDRETEENEKGSTGDPWKRQKYLKSLLTMSVMRRELIRRKLMQHLQDISFTILAIPLPDGRVYRQTPPAVPRCASAYARGFPMLHTCAQELVAQQHLLKFVSIFEDGRDGQVRFPCSGSCPRGQSIYKKNNPSQSDGDKNTGWYWGRSIWHLLTSPFSFVRSDGDDCNAYQDVLNEKDNIHTQNDVEVVDCLTLLQASRDFFSDSTNLKTMSQEMSSCGRGECFQLNLLAPADGPQVEQDARENNGLMATFVARNARGDYRMHKAVKQTKTRSKKGPIHTHFRSGELLQACSSPTRGLPLDRMAAKVVIQPGASNKIMDNHITEAYFPDPWKVSMESLSCELHGATTRSFLTTPTIEMHPMQSCESSPRRPVELPKPRILVEFTNLYDSFAELLGMCGGTMSSGVRHYYTFGNASACLFDSSIEVQPEEVEMWNPICIMDEEGNTIPQELPSYCDEKEDKCSNLSHHWQPYAGRANSFLPLENSTDDFEGSSMLCMERRKRDRQLLSIFRYLHQVFFDTALQQSSSSPQKCDAGRKVVPNAPNGCNSASSVLNITSEQSRSACLTGVSPTAVSEQSAGKAVSPAAGVCSAGRAKTPKVSSHRGWYNKVFLPFLSNCMRNNAEKDPTSKAEQEVEEEVVSFMGNRRRYDALDVNNGHYGLSPFEIWTATRYSRHIAAEVYCMDVHASRGDPYYSSVRVIDEVVEHAVLCYHKHSLLDFLSELENQLGLRYTPQTEWGCALASEGENASKSDVTFDYTQRAYSLGRDVSGHQKRSPYAPRSPLQKGAHIDDAWQESERSGGVATANLASFGPNSSQLSPRPLQKCRHLNLFKKYGCATERSHLCSHDDSAESEAGFIEHMPTTPRAFVGTVNTDEDEDGMDCIASEVRSDRSPVNLALSLHPHWNDSDERLLLRELDNVKEFLIKNRHVLSSASLTVSGSNLLEGVFGVPSTVFPFLIYARESLSFITSTFECIEQHYGPLKYENFASFIRDMFYVDRPDIVRHTPRIFRTLDAKRRGVISFEELCSWFAKKLSCDSNLKPDAHFMAIAMTLRLPLALILNQKPLWNGRKCSFVTFPDGDIEY